MTITMLNGVVAIGGLFVCIVLVTLAFFIDEWRKPWKMHHVKQVSASAYKRESEMYKWKYHNACEELNELRRRVPVLEAENKQIREMLQQLETGAAFRV